MAPLLQTKELDPLIWQACAGKSAVIHSVGSRVYYFAEGHAEHSYSLPDLKKLNPMVLCEVVSVRLLPNPETDEVFIKIGLKPINPNAPVETSVPVMIYKFPESSFERGVDGGSARKEKEGEEVEEEEKEKFRSFGKVLTASDANNGGGFSVPRFCADLIFPKLDYYAEPPVQTISVRDVHGVVWDFRHIFRGTPRRHLLTTGWSKFVNQKKLVAGDSVVFMKNVEGELFVGIRRAARSSVGGQITGEVKMEDGIGGGEGFSRTSKGRVSAESVLKAAELAVAGKPFEVVFYPSAGSPDFVVKAERVERALSVTWIPGLRFKFSVEAEDSSRITCYHGEISSNQGHLRGSPWKMLKVTWDDDVSDNNIKSMTCVSPWMIELLEAQSPFPPPKKLCVPNPEFLADRDGAPPFHMTGYPIMGHIDPSLLGPNSFPVGMQGARHNTIGLPDFPKFLVNNKNQMHSEHTYGNAVSPLSSVSTELNIGSASPSNNSSPPSPGSVNSFGKDRLGHQGVNSVTKAGVISFWLFGQKITITNQSVDTEDGNGGCTEEDGIEGYEGTQGLMNLLDPSLPYENLRTGLDVQCQ